MKPLYLAPMNFFSNYVFRHFILSKGADFVFTELIMADRLELEVKKNKLKLFDPNEISKTIFQIGARNSLEIEKSISKIFSLYHKISELNLNIGCPHSSMQKELVCSGLLFDETKMLSVVETLVKFSKKYGFIPSVKIRLGKNPESIEISHYLKILSDKGINKVYIHARTLRYNYTKPALYSSLKNLKKEFPSMELIYNGDVDSFERYSLLESLGADGIMIARASLSNPEIFSQIKKNKLVRSKKFDPLLNDPEIIFDKGETTISQHKRKLIIDFIKIADNRLNLNQIKTHVLYFLRGLSGRNKISKSINSSGSSEEIINFLETFFD